MFKPSPLQQIHHPLFENAGVHVMVKRDDLIHPIISGNKWRKLKFNITQARHQYKDMLLTFGGAYSNHIHALAYAAHLEGTASHAIIRGEPHYQENYTLSWANHWGMTFEFVDRTTYRLRNNSDYLAELANRYPNSYVIPEGGSNQSAMLGVSEVITELEQQIEGYDTLMCPVGSGGTIAGLIAADDNQHQIIGIPVLKHNGYLINEINKLLGENASHYTQWQLYDGFHCGGYGKFTGEHLQQMLAFYQQTQLPIEPIYSGKMIIALLALIKQGKFPRGHRLVLMHTGGLQGLGGLTERNLIQANEWPSLPVPPAP